MLLRGVNGPCIASGPYSCRYTDAHRMFRCLSGGSSGALLTTFQSRSDLVKLTPVITPTFFSPYHRTFRCLGLAGPLVLFSLNSSAGPTRHCHTTVFIFLANRRPRAAAAPRPYAAAQPPLAHNSTVPPPSPCSATARALQRRARAAPAPRPCRACATCAPLTTRRRHPSLAPPPTAPARLLRVPCTSTLL